MTIDKFCADGKSTPAFGSYQSMFNYYDACENGLVRADSKLKIGGPTTHSSVDATADIITKFLDHVDTGDNFFSEKKGTGTRVDFISIHRKGSASVPGGGNASSILAHERGFFELIRTKHPRLQHLPFLNDEADPLSGWAKNLSWRAGPIFPAFMVKAVAQHLAAMDSSSPPAIDGVPFAMLSNDNSFMGGWNERTLITTFTKTHGGEYSVVKKPDLVVMTLMSRLGVRRLGVQIGGGADAAQLGVIASGPAPGPTSNGPSGGSSGGCVAVMVHRSDDTAPTEKSAVPVALHLNLPMAQRSTAAKGGLASAVTVAHWRLDEANSNPHALWLKQGSPSWPSASQLAAMDQAAEATLLSCNVIPTTNTHGREAGSMAVDINITLPLPAVSLLQICTRPAQGPSAVVLAPVLLQKQLGYVTVIFWRPISTSREVVRTYEVHCSTSGPNGTFLRVNNASDTIGTAWIHRYTSAQSRAQPVARRCYRVFAVDYWGRAGPVSPPACH
jgi:L-iduronidase